MKSGLQFLRGRYVKNILRVLENSELPVGRSLYAADLHHAVLKPDDWIPMFQVAAFTESAVQCHGYWDLGLRAATLPRVQHSGFSEKTLLQKSLYLSLQSICKGIHTEDTSAQFRVVQSQRACWIDCGSVKGEPETVRQVELYRLGSMIDTVRYTAGAGWLPRSVYLQSVDDGRLKDVELLKNVNVRFGASGLSIAVPYQLLPLLPDSSRILRAPRSQDWSLTDPAPDDYEAATRTVIRNQIEWRDVRIKIVAEHLGSSTRSLQRALAAQGTSFTALLEQVRGERAREMLSATGMSQHEIARALGYRYQTDFSRAFKRAYGVTPRQFRSIIRGV